MMYENKKIDVTGLTSAQVRKKYGIPKSSANQAVKRGWFVKNYHKKRLVVNHKVIDNLDYDEIKRIVRPIVYNRKHIRLWSDHAEDMISAIVLRVCELSGLPHITEVKYLSRLAKLEVASYKSSWLKGRPLQLSDELWETL